MKAKLGKKKNVRGRIVCHTATIGPFEGQGETPALASEAVEIVVRGALARLDEGMSVRVWRGHAAAVAPSVGGWAYWIDTSGGLYETNSHDRAEAMGRALHHLAQNVWDPSVQDDRAFVEGLPGDVAKEIAGWIRFQRAYKRIAAEGGRSDNEVHRLACEASYVSP
jgi:hypothetical protein